MLKISDLLPLKMALPFKRLPLKNYPPKTAGW